jgi:UPF0755 protein
VTGPDGPPPGSGPPPYDEHDESGGQPGSAVPFDQEQEVSRRSGPSDEPPLDQEPHIYGTEPRAPGPAHRAGRRRRRPWRIVVLVVIIVGVLVLVGGYFWVNSEADPSGPPGPSVIVEVASGSGTSQLASQLQDHGVIGSSLAYRIWSQLHGSPEVLTGSYSFHRNLSFATVKNIIAGGPNVFPLTIPPGFTVREVAERVGQLPGHDQAAFAALADGGTVHSPFQPAGVTNLDGLLGTGTYTVVPGETDRQLLVDMVDRFNTQADALDLTRGSAALGLTPYQAVIVASIVEKEGVITKNLGPVARVILNRLANQMPLQMNSTVLYALDQDGGQVTQQDLELKSPYNTYLHVGLTPTPICFPSPAALQATLHPPQGKWLYFVLVKSDGTEAFADTYSEQLANEALANQRGLG